MTVKQVQYTFGICEPSNLQLVCTVFVVLQKWECLFVLDTQSHLSIMDESGMTKELFMAPTPSRTLVSVL